MIKKITKSSTIALVELPPTQFGILDGNAGFDVYTKFKLPPRALPTLTSVLRSQGYRNVNMFTIFHGTIAANWPAISRADILMISAITRTEPPSMELMRRYKSVNPRGRVIVGGMGPSYRPHHWIEAGADVVVIGEGEATLTELMQRLLDGSDLTGCLGIAYKGLNRQVVINAQRPFMTAEELSALPVPYYDGAIKNNINTIAIEQERGCPYSCDFCLVTQAYGHRVSCLSPQAVMARVRELGPHSKQWFFTGDNFAANPTRAMAQTQAMIAGGFLPGSGTAQVSAQARKHPELLAAMRKAGIDNLCVGFESVSDDALRDLNKPFNAEENTQAAQAFREAGFWIHAMTMVGSDSDDLSSIRQTLEWAQLHADSLQLFSPTHFAGTPRYDRIIAEGREITNDLSLYDCQHVVFQPNKLSAYELQKAIFNTYNTFYSPKWTLDRLRRAPRKIAALGVGAYTMFGGLKGVIDDPQSRAHLETLRSSGL